LRQLFFRMTERNFFSPRGPKKRERHGDWGRRRGMKKTWWNVTSSILCSNVRKFEDISGRRVAVTVGEKNIWWKKKSWNITYSQKKMSDAIGATLQRTSRQTSLWQRRVLDLC
jgi:hypothetical protein